MKYLTKIALVGTLLASGCAHRKTDEFDRTQIHQYNPRQQQEVIYQQPTFTREQVVARLNKGLEKEVGKNPFASTLQYAKK